MSFVRVERVCEPQQDIRVPQHIDGSATDGRTLREDVSELNGLAVPALFERHSTGGRCSLQQASVSGSSGAYHADAARELHSMPDFLRLAAIYGYVTGGFTAKPEQIRRYDWLPPALHEPLLAVLATHLGGTAVEYEIKLEYAPGAGTADAFGGNVHVSGRMDALTAEYIYELKCVHELKPEHLLQLALYGWLWHAVAGGSGQPCAATHGARRLRLLNFRTGELLELVSTPEELGHVARVLVEAYLRGEPALSDDVFVAQCAQAQRSAGAQAQ